MEQQNQQNYPYGKMKSDDNIQRDIRAMQSPTVKNNQPPQFNKMFPEQNINYQMLGRKYIPLPPLGEQRAIVAHIETKCAKVDSLVTELEAEIEHLKEYKQRLIADCVTGQIKV